jgi:hypothetical protein
MWNLSSTAVQQQQQDGEAMGDDDAAVVGRARVNTLKQSTEAGSESASTSPTTNPLSTVLPSKSFFLGDSRSSSLESDDVTSTTVADGAPPRHRQGHLGAYLFRSAAGRSVTAVDLLRGPRRQCHVDQDNPPTSQTSSDDDAAGWKTSGPAENLFLPAIDSAPSIVVNEATSDDDIDNSLNGSSTSTSNEIIFSLGKTEDGHKQKTMLTATVMRRNSIIALFVAEFQIGT